MKISKQSCSPKSYLIFHCIIVMAPQFEVPLNNPIYLFRGGTMYIECLVRAGPIPVKTWYKDGTIVTGRKRFISNADGKLEIKNVQNSDAGIYVCKAENSIGKAESSGTAIILGKFLTSSSNHL